MGPRSTTVAGEPPFSRSYRKTAESYSEPLHQRLIINKASPLPPLLVQPGRELLYLVHVSSINLLLLACAFLIANRASPPLPLLHDQGRPAWPFRPGRCMMGEDQPVTNFSQRTAATCSGGPSAFQGEARGACSPRSSASPALAHHASQACAWRRRMRPGDSRQIRLLTIFLSPIDIGLRGCAVSATIRCAAPASRCPLG